MKKTANLIFLLTAIGAWAQQSGNTYQIEIQRVRTDHEVRISAVLTVGTDKYEIETKCFSTDADYPCIVPHLGLTDPIYIERNGKSFLQLRTDDNGHGQQTMAEIVEIRESK